MKSLSNPDDPTLSKRLEWKILSGIFTGMLLASVVVLVVVHIAKWILK